MLQAPKSDRLLGCPVSGYDITIGWAFNTERNAFDG